MFAKYSNFIESASFNLTQPHLQDELLIEESGDLSVYYAPFDYINLEAKIVICGITPGFQQAILALSEASRQLKLGATFEEAMLAAKNTASFGGPMRSNLIRLLDFIGVPGKLDIDSSSEMFGSKANLVHYTSALRYPVFKSGANYSGVPSMISYQLLRRQIETFLVPELAAFSKSTVFIPLGPKVEEALEFCGRVGAIQPEQILSGLPHPSGANAERIAYFLNEKAAANLSAKTNPQKIDEARKRVLAKIACI